MKAVRNRNSRTILAKGVSRDKLNHPLTRDFHTRSSLKRALGPRAKGKMRASWTNPPVNMCPQETFTPGSQDLFACEQRQAGNKQQNRAWRSLNDLYFTGETLREFEGSLMPRLRFSEFFLNSLAPLDPDSHIREV